jgi:5-formyltetrahydrofolate cyclo-ligase
MSLTKADFRNNCLKKMKNSSLHNKLYKDNLINLKLLKLLKSNRRKKILFYHPMPFEANIIKTITKLRKKNNVYLPFMQGESFKMVPFRLPLKQNFFGIFEAADTIKKIKYIDIAIVPAVGVDVNLQRIGFGKGMYDRFFAKLKKKPYTIFIQPELCYTKKSICDAYDVSCDLLLTPRVQLLNKRK